MWQREKLCSWPPRSPGHRGRLGRKRHKKTELWALQRGRDGCARDGAWSGNVLQTDPCPPPSTEPCGPRVPQAVGLRERGVLTSWAQLTVPNSPELTKVSLLARSRCSVVLFHIHSFARDPEMGGEGVVPALVEAVTSAGRWQRGPPHPLMPSHQGHGGGVQRFPKGEIR